MLSTLFLFMTTCSRMADVSSYVWWVASSLVRHSPGHAVGCPSLVAWPPMLDWRFVHVLHVAPEFLTGKVQRGNVRRVLQPHRSSKAFAQCSSLSLPDWPKGSNVNIVSVSCLMFTETHHKMDWNQLPLCGFHKAHHKNVQLDVDVGYRSRR